MQFRVYYKHISVKKPEAKDCRHEVDSPAGFAIFYGNIRPGLPDTVVSFPLPDVAPPILQKEDVDQIMDICQDSMKGG